MGWCTLLDTFARSNDHLAGRAHQETLPEPGRGFWGRSRSGIGTPRAAGGGTPRRLGEPAPSGILGPVPVLRTSRLRRRVLEQLRRGSATGPELAAVALERWPRLMCRHPRPEDFVVPRPYRFGPRPTVAHHTEQSLGVKTVRYYAERVGVDDTGRDFHSFRRAMITLARTDGASKDVLERVTHNAAGEVIDGYTTYFAWEALCEAVSAIRLAPLRGVVAVRRIRAAAADEEASLEDVAGHADGHATDDTPQNKPFCGVPSGV